MGTLGRDVLVVVLVLLAGCGGGDGSSWSQVTGGPAAPTSICVVDEWAFSPTDVWFLDGSANVYRHDGSDFETVATPSTGGLACNTCQPWIVPAELVPA